MTDPLPDLAATDASPARWVSATSLRHFLLDDPILDWLDRYGQAHGYVRDDHLDSFDPRTDFLRYLLKKGREFEAGVIRHLGGMAEVHEVGVERRPSPSLLAAAETRTRMCAGDEIIYRGVLLDEESHTFGEPDLLVRGDVLARLFPDLLSAEEIATGAPALDLTDFHYRVVDIKMSTLRLTARGELRAEGSAAAFRAQVWVYNRALGRLQGYEPPSGYVLGRSWEQQLRPGTLRGFDCMERLGAVSQSDENLANRVDAAAVWIRRIRQEGHGWSVLPRPSIPELWPNFSNRTDAPWHHAKRMIGEELGELTDLWGVGLGRRVLAHRAEVFSWRDLACTPELLGVPPDARGKTLGAILEVNQHADGPIVRPEHVSAAEETWRPVRPLEFYVDFESVSDLADDFATLPERGGQPMIFMIGCGHMEGDTWQFTSFVTDALTDEAEGRTIDAWFAHMAEVRSRIWPDGDEPLVVHWSPAEESTLERSYTSAAQRHSEARWPSPKWFDFLSRVVRAEPIVVRGALAFGLKEFARALHDAGCIETDWDDALSDGLAAAVGAWWCAEEGERIGVPMNEMDLMREIARYNEVDCKVMMEIVQYLRATH